MADPNPAPLDPMPSVEGSQSTSPAEVPGLQHRLLDPALNSLRRGRVDDIYMGSFCALVSVYSYRSRVPCIWLQGAMNRWSGAKQCMPPSIGTEVVVWLSNDHKYGFIVGAINPPLDRTDKPKASIAHTDIDQFAKTEIHDPKAWGMLGFLLDSSSGLPRDVLPGDNVVVNENAAAQALLKFVTLIRGGEASKIEAFVFDELLRITGYNYQFRSITSERNLLNDFGQVDDTLEFTHRQSEGEGIGTQATEAEGGETDSNGNPTGVKEGREAGRWRFKRFFGALGDFFQKFLVRPHKTAGSLDNPDKRPDMGLHQDVLELNGHRIIRSVTAVGIHKTPAIAVPKKRFDADDPEGDSEAVEDPKPKDDFVFKDTFPNAPICQLSDYFAWLYNTNLPKRLLDKPKDWHVPDEANCPVIGDIKDIRKPGVGGFYREVLAPVDVLGGHNDYDNDTTYDGKKATLGEAFIHTMPDGSVVIRDNCGSSIVMSNGHIDISASHDIRLFAGGTLVALAGDDAIIKARKSVDITSTENQLRLKSQRDMFIHAEDGGMLLSLGHRGFGFSPKERGERRTLPGIAIKVPEQGGFLVSAGQATFNLDNRFYINGNTPGKYPEIETQARAMYHWLREGGSTAYNFDGKYILMQGGACYASGLFQTDSNVYARRDILSGHWIGGILVGPSDWSKVPTLASVINQAGTFAEGTWQKFQYQYTLEELQKLKFTFRTVQDYATQQGAWIQEFWQRDLGTELDKWTEKKDSEGEYPYPGRAHYEGKNSIFVYEEGNVDTKTGRPVPREEQTKEGGDFKPVNWNSLTVLPAR